MPDRSASRDSFWRLRTAARSTAKVVVIAVLIALPITALRAFYQPIDWRSFLSTVLVGLSYGMAYVLVFQGLVPAIVDRRPSDRPAGFDLAVGLVGLASAIAVGGFTNEWLQGLLAMATEQHWWVGGSIVVIARLIELDHQALLRRVDATELQQARWRDQASRAELRALQARVDPHFLFNSLNTIAGLIEEDADRAVAVVTRLAGLYRHTLKSSRATTVRLADEIEAVDAFLEMSALRFEDRLRYEIAVAPGADERWVPPACLLPLAENAVLHGLAWPTGRDESGRSLTIRVRAEPSADGLRLAVDDDGPGPEASNHRGSGTALADLRERLDLVSQGRARLTTRGRQPRGFSAAIDWPDLDAAPADPERASP